MPWAVRKRRTFPFFNETTAGILAFIRPCGRIAGMAKLFTTESYTQVFLFILRTFCKDVEDFQRLNILATVL